MLNKFPKDILLYITKYLYSRDLINLKLCSVYFNKNIDYNGKIIDHTQDIIHNIQILLRIQHCKVCGHILSRDEAEIEYCYRCEDTFMDKIDVKSMYVVDMKYVRYYTLFSSQDLECLRGNCNCESKRYLFIHPNLPRTLVPKKSFRKDSYKINYPKYIIETDYGKMLFDSKKYEKQNILFTYVIIYTTIYSLPKILQTDKHHWLVLNNSMMKVIPIKNIIPVS